MADIDPKITQAFLNAIEEQKIKKADRDRRIREKAEIALLNRMYAKAERQEEERKNREKWERMTPEEQETVSREFIEKVRQLARNSNNKKTEE